MPDIKSIIEQMINNGESDEDIDLVVQHFKGINPPPPPKPPAQEVDPTDPGTFAGGFSRSLFSGEALEAGLNALPGFFTGLKNAPASMLMGAKDILDFKLNPGLAALRMTEGMRQIPGIVSRSGSDPDPYGQMVGDITGQTMLGMLGPKAVTAPRDILRNPRVSGGLSRLGSALEGTRPPNNVPTTPRGLVAGAIKGGAGVVGRGLQKLGEKGRLGAAGVEPAIDLAARPPTRPRMPPRRTPSSQSTAQPPIETIDNMSELPPRKPTTPPPDIPSKPPEAQVPPETQPPIVETADAMAARGVRPQSSSRFSPAVNTANEVDPMFQDPTVVETIDNMSELPPNRPTGRPEPFTTEVSDVDPMFRVEEPAPPAAPPKESFQPTTDPKTFAPEDVALIQAQKDKVRAILKEMAAREAGVDPTTGEIVPPKRAKNWRMSEADTPTEEAGFFGEERPFDTANDEGIAFGNEVEAGAAPHPDAYDLGDISQPVNLEEPIPIRRPEVPPGQLTNRDMFRYSEMRELENRAAAQNRPPSRFSNAGPEFEPDMMFTPEETVQPDIPEMRSDVPNPYDPRTAPGGVVSELGLTEKSPFKDIQNRMYELVDKGTNGTLTAEELTEAQRLNKIWRDHPEFGQPFSEFDKARLQRMKNTSEKKHTNRKSMFQFARDLAKDETGSVGPKIEKKTIGQPSPLASKLVKEGSVVRTQTKNVGPRGQTFQVTGPNGKKLGSFAVTNEQVEEILKAYGDEIAQDPDAIAKLVYENHLEDILDQHGLKEHDVKVDTVDNRKTKAPTEPKKEMPYPFGPKETSVDPTDLPEGSGMFKLQSEEGVEFPNDKLAGPSKMEQTPSREKSTSLFEKEKPAQINADEAFGPGGDVKPIIEAANKLDKTAGGDLKFKPLLPRSMQYALEKGETYKQRLSNLLEASGEIDAPLRPNPRQVEIDKFIDSIRKVIGEDAIPKSNEPLLNLKKLTADDFKTPITGNLRRLLGRERAPTPMEKWERPKPKRKPRE